MSRQPRIDNNIVRARNGKLLPLNASGKTQVLKSIKTPLQQVSGIRIVRFLASGRGSPFERNKAAIDGPMLTRTECREWGISTNAR